ncbi:MAG TPA: STAS domain-containing protein [Actinomycetota bacterium]|nr:STAS domain-containing protein [Actinomycetota bacterium]
MIEHTERPRGYRLRGEIDLTAADALARTLQRAVGDEGPLQLDLSDVTFLDSIGLAVVIRTALSLEGRGSLVLKAPRPSVRRVLEISGTLRVPNVLVLD